MKEQLIERIPIAQIHIANPRSRSRGRWQMIVANIGDDDVHPRTQQCLGDAESDSAGSAGHERGLAGQILHVVRSSPSQHGRS